MTEQIVSEKSQHLAQALLLEQVRYTKQQLLDQKNPQFIQNFISQTINKIRPFLHHLDSIF